ncbi:hypothetical protein QOZ89_18270 [Pseudofrankia sp. BMG5.37]|nr:MULTISPECIES: hypothetical protein [unclassified Pseudofrankia]MDT3441528.1 hypothetical protein [Pseudofrankia sp. BMG5.37]
MRAPVLLGLEAGAGVDADDLGVQVAVGEQLDGQGGELVRGAEAVREEDVALQLVLERSGARAFAVDRGVDEPGGDALLAAWRRWNEILTTVLPTQTPA